MSENGLFLSSEKNLFPPTDYWARARKDSAHNKPGNQSDQWILKIESDSFIVDWQLFDDEKSYRIPNVPDGGSSW